VEGEVEKVLDRLVATHAADPEVLPHLLLLKHNHLAEM